MKIKAGIFMLILLIFIGGAVYVNHEVKNLDPGLKHDLYTIYGDEKELDDIEISLRYKTDTIVWDGDLEFSNGELTENVSTFEPDINSEDPEKNYYSRINPTRTEQEVFEQWLYRHYDIYPKAVRYGDDLGYFCAMKDPSEDEIPSYLFDENWVNGKKPEYDKYKLPEGNGIYRIDYVPNPTASYILQPDPESTHLAMEMDEEAVIRSMGTTMMGSVDSDQPVYLEVFYTEDGRLKFKAIDALTEETAGELDITEEANLGKNLNVLYPENFFMDEGELTLVIYDKGFTLISFRDGKFEKVMERIYDENDSRDLLEGLLSGIDYRCLNADLKEDRLVIASRVVRGDPLYDEHKGTYILVYEKGELRYAGIIGSDIYSSDDARLEDFYALYQYQNELIESEEDIPEEDADFIFYGYWSYFDINNLMFRRG